MSEIGARNTTVTLRFPQLGRSIRSKPDDDVFQSARRHGVRIVGACGGRGTCGSCIVQVVDGVVEHNESESDTGSHDDRTATKRWIRACQARPRSDLVIEIAPRSLAPVARAEPDTGADDERLDVDPAVTSRDVVVHPPSLADPASDADRVRRALAHPQAVFDLAVLRRLPRMLREASGAVRVRMHSDEIIDVAGRGRHALGLAIDLGTTNAAGFLLDLEVGVRIAGLGIENPQTAWGADVISRLNHAILGETQAAELRDAALVAINALAHDLTHAVGASTADIVNVVIAGNTAMHHLALGLPVRQLGRAPFVAATRDGVDAKARELGIVVAPGAWVHVVPNVGGFIGGDHVAALLATEPLWRACHTSVVMDIGTNTEISLIHEGQIRSASSPSGPALEGGNIGCGMRAADGAIERVSLDGDGRLVVRTINDEPPVGLCGSGVIDALAALYRARVVDERGRLVKYHEAIVSHEGQRAAQLAPGVVFTQADVRAVQLAKAAIRTALELLLDDAQIDAGAIDAFMIAGSFGAYINVGSAIAIGLLPDIPIARYRQVGNAAGLGVRMALASGAARRRAADLARNCRSFELSTRSDFQKRFVRNIGLPAVPPLAMETTVS
ncbi:MAG: DUF4445 domain-containing protein [Burkholderiaceae bacterium]|nr:DUF4445 domain-containing protein [Burkholderiaceae bacterium]